MDNIDNRSQRISVIAESIYNLDNLNEITINEAASLYKYSFESEVKMVEALEELLMEIGITPIYKGFNYIVDAIRIMYRKRLSHVMITKDIYMPLAKLYGTSSNLIEHCIRSAVKKSWEKTDSDLRKTLFRDDKKCPSNFNFLICISHCLYRRIGL